MKILKAKYTLLCDENFTILEDKAIAFDEYIRATGNFEDLKKRFLGAEILDYSNDIAMPCFVNPHVHLEFSSNKSTLLYGDFIKWVGSVIQNRDDISSTTNSKLIREKITLLMRSGVSTIGEISSFGTDLEACASSGARVVFFNEILGANKDIVATNWKKFIDRFDKSDKLKNDLFLPAISVHSPYSTHPKLTKKACKFAKHNDLLVSTHLLESDHENRWLRKGSGEFKKWLKSFNPNPKPMYSPKSFIKHFSEVRTLFTHCVYLKELNLLNSDIHSITTCAFSNRLLSKKKLNLKNILKNDINLTIGTDGLSSN
ncbi:MAG: metal-dependent hydrolase, partial [Campylobacter sp.]|nr:metal-dependent hydrolase [Campylobacter sp.]